MAGCGVSEKEVGSRMTEIIMVRIYSFSTAGFGVVFKFIGGYGMKNKTISSCQRCAQSHNCNKA